VGYDRMTVEALAARAGVSKPTIYRRWPGGKPDVLLDAIRSRHPDTEHMPDTGSLRGDLMAMLSTMVAGVEEDAHLAAGIIGQLRASEELTRLFRDEVIADERRRYDRLLARAVARGELSADARVTALLPDVAGSIVFTRAVMMGGPLDTAFIEELVDHVLLPILTPHPRGS
jgi:AcrR family transcriptional regulator